MEDSVKARELLATREVATRYGWCVDERRADVLEEMFTSEVEWTGCGDGDQSLGRVRGRGAVLELLDTLFWRQSAQSRHLMSSPMVERQDSTGAAVCQGFMLAFSTRAGSNMAGAGVNRFDLVKDAGSWSIARIFTGFDSVERIPGAAALLRKGM